MTFTVAIVGRPNVGKSTLFNRLVGQRLALVDDAPGVTRDRREGEGLLFDLSFRVVDTAGMDEAAEDTLEGRMRAQSDRAAAEADLVLFLVDARAGVTGAEATLADALRRTGQPVQVLANKCEGEAGWPGLLEAHGLGLGEALPLSAAHGEGLDALYEILAAAMAAAADAAAERPADDDPAAGAAETIRLAVVGRPNAGKSTLINRLLGDDRLLTGPEAGITRDSIALDWTWRGRAFTLIDTAGMRRKARVAEKLEKLAVADGLRALNFAHVAVLAIDAVQGLDKQDLHLADRAVQEGRALVIALTKWDAVGDLQATRAAVADRLQRSLPQVKGLPVVPVSALTGRGVAELLDAVLRVYDLWTTKVATPDLNAWLAEVTEAQPPPMVKGRRPRIKYATQPKARPPTFVLFCTRPQDLADSYLRYLENALRHDFDLPGVPLRLQTRKSR